MNKLPPFDDLLAVAKYFDELSVKMDAWQNKFALKHKKIRGITVKQQLSLDEHATIAVDALFNLSMAFDNAYLLSKSKANKVTRND
tara:strand:+ start:111 stop:368 length:258 start_codon:yes stop_codon:yes gene_type:complete